jgi:ligand-binding SRPBCC domain-containing protein
MAVFQRGTRVRAPFDDVWEFHSRVSGLEGLTPGWMNLRVESVVGPDGDPDPDVLEAGARIESSVRPFGVGPRQSWMSVIEARESYDGAAYFRDGMDDGPFAHWEHTHSFFAVDDGTTVVRDRVEYRLPDGLGPVSPLARVGMEPMFRYRHRRTRELLE